MEVSQKHSSVDTSTQTVVIPFGLTYNPMKKLALINFEKNPDSVYLGLEPQYFDDEIYGKGFRILAYRHDHYVDVYNDVNLNDVENESFDVVGKGLGEQKKVVIENTFLHKKDGCTTISFKFNDKAGRPIIVNITEHSKKKSKGMNLLAPVGSSTENPSYLPLFFLYDFDFIRKHKTTIDITIDGKKIKADNFPFPLPKDLQWRTFCRYSMDCQIIEFANATEGVLDECTTDSTGLVARGPLEYQYEKDILKNIELKQTNHRFLIEFGRGFPNIKSLKDQSEYKDTFKMSPDKSMGFVSGEYSVTREANEVKIELIPSGGWTPVSNSLLTKILFTKKSVFCSWPKTYTYVQKVDITTLHSKSYWERMK